MKCIKVSSFQFQTWNEEMEKALEAGEASDLFGTNQHYQIPVNYLDFGRRFVLTYPYSEVRYFMLT